MPPEGHNELRMDFNARAIFVGEDKIAFDTPRISFQQSFDLQYLIGEVAISNIYFRKVVELLAGRFASCYISGDSITQSR